MIPFNKPPYTGNEEKYVIESMKSSKISGDGEFTKKCHKWFEEKLNCKKALLVSYGNCSIRDIHFQYTNLLCRKNN